MKLAGAGGFESVIGAGMVVRGTLHSEGAVRIDGRIEGNVVAHAPAGAVAGTARAVDVGPQGRVCGHISATHVRVEGRVEGNIESSGRIEIAPGAKVAGDLECASLEVMPGATVEGRILRKAAPSAGAEPAVAGTRRVNIS